MAKTQLTSKFLGGMVGSALGDAIGELAFHYPERDLLGSKMERIFPLRYTDDTAMAIGLAESLTKKRCVDQEHLGRTFSHNFDREPWRGYASGPPTIFAAVKERGITYSEAAQDLFRGGGSFGNGAAMRIVPVGLFFHQFHDLYTEACDSARVTHAHSVGMDGAAIQALAIAQALRLDPKKGLPFERFMGNLAGAARTEEIKVKMSIVRQLILQRVPPEPAARRLGRSVAVHESMPFAAYSFLRHAGSFEECIFCAIMNGGDRDTLGAMAGAISGAYLGVAAIPPAWRAKLENLAYIERLASTLAKISEEEMDTTRQTGRNDLVIY